MYALELTGRAMLTLLPTAALPAPIGTITRLPMDARCQSITDELFGPEDAA